MLRKIFGKKSHTLESLTADYKDLAASRESKAAELDQMKRDALKASDATKAVDAIQKSTIELELVDSALAEIREMMADIMRKEVEDNFAAVSNRKQQYTDEFRLNAREAGRMMGEAVAILQKLRKSHMSRIATDVVGAVGNVSSQFNEDALFFSMGFDEGRCSNPADLPDFGALQKSIAMQEQKVPGSPGVERGIAVKINRMLGIEEKTKQVAFVSHCANAV